MDADIVQRKGNIAKQQVDKAHSRTTVNLWLSVLWNAEGEARKSDTARTHPADSTFE